MLKFHKISKKSSDTLDDRRSYLAVLGEDTLVARIKPKRFWVPHTSYDWQVDFIEEGADPEYYDTLTDAKERVRGYIELVVQEVIGRVAADEEEV